MKAKKSAPADVIDQKFEDGESILEYTDVDDAFKKVNVDFPLWMIKELDAEATRLQIPRQAAIKQLIDLALQTIKKSRESK